jgi:hypothetical protein
MAKTLAATGLKGEALSKALEEAAVKAAKLEFGPNFEKEMLSIDRQSEKLKKNISSLFSGLKIDALETALSKIVDLFDKNSESGKAMKAVFEDVFQNIIDAATGLVPKIVSTFLAFEIAVLKALIAIKPWWSTIKLVGEAILVLAVIVTAVMVLGLLLLIACIVILMIPLIAVIALVIYFSDELSAAGDAVMEFGQSIIDGVSGAIDWLSNLSLSDIGSDLIDGLVSGITTAGPKVLTAITGLAKGAVDAAKKALGIASPSTVFMEIGGHTAAGMEAGVDDGADGVQKSLEDLVAPPGKPGAAGVGASASSGKGGGGDTYTITIQGGGDAQSNVEAFAAWFESRGAQLGTAVGT